MLSMAPCILSVVRDNPRLGLLKPEVKRKAKRLIEEGFGRITKQPTNQGMGSQRCLPKVRAAWIWHGQGYGLTGHSRARVRMSRRDPLAQYSVTMQGG